MRKLSDTQFAICRKPPAGARRCPRRWRIVRALLARGLIHEQITDGTRPADQVLNHRLAHPRERGDEPRAMAAELNARGMLTRRGGRWHVSTVTNLLDRIGPRRDHAPPWPSPLDDKPRD